MRRDGDVDHKIAAPEQSSRGGPRTAAGRRRTRLNAVKIGIFANIVLAGEQSPEQFAHFRKLRGSLRESIRPVDSVEAIFVENLAVQYLRLARVYQADAAMAPILFRVVREKMESDGLDSPTPGFPPDEPFGAGKLPAAELLMRYESGISRQIDRIFDQLDRWRKARKERDGRESENSA